MSAIVLYKDIRWDQEDLIQHVSLSLIRRDKNNPRRNASQENMDELIESIREKGVQTPVKIRPPVEGEEDGYAYLVGGHRRLFACTKVNLESMPCIVRPAGPTLADRLEDLLGDNELQEELPPVDRARAYSAIMKDRRMTQGELAAHLRKSPLTIGKSLSLLELPEKAQELVNRGSVSRQAAELILKLTSSAEERNKLAGRVHTGELSTRRLQAMITDKKDENGHAASGKRTASHSSGEKFERRFPLGGETRTTIIVSSRRVLSDEEIEAALTQARGQLSIDIAD